MVRTLEEIALSLFANSKRMAHSDATMLMQIPTDIMTELAEAARLKGLEEGEAFNKRARQAARKVNLMWSGGVPPGAGQGISVKDDAVVARDPYIRPGVWVECRVFVPNSEISDVD